MGKRELALGCDRLDHSSSDRVHAVIAAQGHDGEQSVGSARRFKADHIADLESRGIDPASQGEDGFQRRPVQCGDRIVSDRDAPL